MAGIELIKPISGEFIRLIPGIRHGLTDVTPEAIARARDIISREDVLYNILNDYRKIIPNEFIPIQGIARGEHNTLYDVSGKPMLKTILGDREAMDRTKQIHNLAQKTERQLANDEYLNSNILYSPEEGRVAINNPYDEVPVGDMLDDKTLGIDYTQVHPLSRAIYEMTQKALQHHGLSNEDKLVLLRKTYANARRGNVNEPVLSLTSDSDSINNVGFNRAFGAWNTPINAFEVSPKNVMTSDLILPQNYGEREMQVAKQALEKVGSMRRTPGSSLLLDYTEFDKEGWPMSEAFNTIDTAQFAYPRLINDVLGNKLDLLNLYKKFYRENGRRPTEQEIKMMEMIVNKLNNG